MAGKTERSVLRCPCWYRPGLQTAAEFLRQTVDERNTLMFVRIRHCQQKEELPTGSPPREVPLLPLSRCHRPGRENWPRLTRGETRPRTG